MGAAAFGAARLAAFFLGADFRAALALFTNFLPAFLAAFATLPAFFLARAMPFFAAAFTLAARTFLAGFFFFFFAAFLAMDHPPSIEVLAQ
jgi:hypothetical protein